MRLGISLSLTQQFGGFSPASLFASGEQGVWYDPSDLSTMFQNTLGTIPVTAAGQSVALLRDKSGRGNHATQATAAARPIYQVDANGRSFLLFDGVDDGLSTTSIAFNSGSAQIVAGVTKLSDVAAAMVAESGNMSPAGSVTMFAPAGANATYSFRSRGSVAAVDVTASPFAAPITSVVTGLGDTSMNTCIIRVNGVQAGSRTTAQGATNYISAPIYVGRRSTGVSPFNGRVYGLVMRFGPTLTSDQTSVLEAWMNGKTGAY